VFCSLMHYKIRSSYIHTLSMRTEAFHFLEAALPAMRSNSVGEISRPPSRMTNARCTSKLPRIVPQHTRKCVGMSLAGTGLGAGACMCRKVAFKMGCCSYGEGHP